MGHALTWAYTIYVKLKARGLNQARDGIILGPQDDIQLLLTGPQHYKNMALHLFIAKGDENDLITRLV